MAESELERDLEALTSLRDPTRRALYLHVARQPHAVSRADAAGALSISVSLAAFHLDRLVAAGLLTTQYRRLSGRTGPGAGRPAKLYRRSRRRVSINVPPRDPELLARVLAATIPPSDPEAGTFAEATEIGHSLGARARRRLRSRPASDRLLACIADVLESIGFEPARSGDRRLTMQNCPFDPLSKSFTPVVCGVGISLARGVVDGVGSDLRVTRNERADGCCVVVSDPRLSHGAEPRGRRRRSERPRPERW